MLRSASAAFAVLSFPGRYSRNRDIQHVLGCVLNELWFNVQLFRKSTDASVNMLLVLPYFLEKHLQRAGLDQLKMLDYQVCLSVVANDLLTELSIYSMERFIMQSICICLCICISKHRFTIYRPFIYINRFFFVCFGNSLLSYECWSFSGFMLQLLMIVLGPLRESQGVPAGQQTGWRQSYPDFHGYPGANCPAA